MDIGPIWILVARFRIQIRMKIPDPDNLANKLSMDINNKIGTDIEKNHLTCVDICSQFRIFLVHILSIHV